MARISRVVASGYPHHVTQRGVRSIPVFHNDGDRNAYLEFMAEELKRFSVDVLAWCLMTDHTQLIVVPNDAGVLSRAIGEAHRRYTRMKKCRSICRAQSGERGNVNDGARYPWSSARYHLGVSQQDRLVRDKTLLGLVDNWSEYLSGSDEPATQSTLLRGLRTGRPAGNEQFVEMLERKTGRDLVQRKAGHPLKQAF
jgi:putative transposase